MASFLSSIISYPYFALSKYFIKSKDLKIHRPNIEEFNTPNDSSSKDRKFFSGIISSLNEGEAVINNEIYFTVDSHYELKFKVGDKVEGEAVRPNEFSAWRAIKLTPVSVDWDFPEPNNFALDVQPIGNEIGHTIVGKVVNIYNNLISLNTSISFYNNDNCDIDVPICIGDWIQCEIEATSKRVTGSSVLSVRKVSPLRRKFIHGVILYFQPTYFVVSGEVYCEKSLFPNRFKYKERVVAEVIESDQRKYSWRAINIWNDLPKSENSTHTNLTLTKFLVDFAEKKIDEIPETSSSLSESEDKVNSTNKDIIFEGNCNINLKGVGFIDFIKLIIKNNSPTCSYKLENIEIVSTNLREKQLKLDKSVNFPISLKAETDFPLNLYCIGKSPGSAEEVISFSFDNGLIIKKQIQINVNETNKHQHGIIKIINTSKENIIKGEKPIYASPFLPIKLPRAEIPEWLWEAVFNQEKLTDVIPLHLNIDNYIERLSTLLFLEEIEMNLQMRKFDISCTSFARHGDYLSLSIEGLSESRPSLIVGDSVIATSPDPSSDGVKYEGIIHQVLHSKVLLKFNPNFHLGYEGEDYSVQLCFNRTPLRRCHQAISLATKQLGEAILFPSSLKFREPQVVFIDPDSDLINGDEETGGKEFHDLVQASASVETTTAKNGDEAVLKREGLTLRWFNKDLNLEQRTAVKRILEGSLRPLPYIIFGPPGTGKTVTLVEAVLQIYKMIPHSRILVVCPSNSASDLVAERAIQSSDLQPGELIRLNAFNRSTNNISACLEPYCTTGSDLKITVRHRIIVSTAVTAGFLYTARIKNGHFTHVFIDEAGQLTEPEILISMNLVNCSNGEIILAGDPRQLGPFVSSSLAKRYGLNMSFLHRLCNSVIYQPQDRNLQSVYSNKYCSEIECSKEISNHDDYYEPGLVTLLVKNYRSHFSLLAVPSKLFEGIILTFQKNFFLDWKELPNPCCPLIFHPVQGENFQEGDSPSWFNPAEVYQVSHYTLSLLKFGVKPSDIGIIAPYKKQVEKIRGLLGSFGVDEGIKVGPVEEFQGQERLAVILSTVRSSRQLIQDDVCHNLGFVRCAERFNVAITRAIGLLIVVGNPLLLSQDPNWNEFLGYCLSKKAIKKN